MYGEPGEAAPDDGVSGRRIAGSGQVAAEPRDLDQVGGKRLRARGCLRLIGHKTVEKRNLHLCEGKARTGARGGAVDHRQPEHAPAQDAEEVGDQLPVDRGSIGGCGTLPGLDHREPERGIALLLADGWQNANTAVLDFDSRDLDTALAVANLTLMHALDAHFIHLGSYRVMTITRTTVDAAPDDEVGAELLGRAEQLVDVALAITDMDAPCRCTEQGHGLA